MTITAQIPIIQRHEMPMSTTNHAHAIDGVVETIAVAMLKWSRAREEHSVMNHVEHSRRRQLWASEQHREIDALRLTQRLGF